MKRITIFAILILMVAGNAWAAPSAKTTFTYAELNVVTEASGACDPYADTPDPCTSDDLASLASSEHQIMSAMIKMPKHKELLIDVSLECGNFLETQVKSKGGDKNSANAEATVRVLVIVNDGSGWKPALPSGNPNRDLIGDGTWTGPTEGVVFCHRSQELEAKFQGIFTTNTDQAGWFGDEDELFYSIEADCLIGGDGEQTCTAVTLVGTCLYEDQSTGKIFADLDCFEPEEIRLTTASMTANSFSFMYPNTERSGEHQVAVIAYLDTGRGLGGDDESGSSTARAMVGLGSMSVQTVRMVKGPISVSTRGDCTVGSPYCTELD